MYMPDVDDDDPRYYKFTPRPERYKLRWEKLYGPNGPQGPRKRWERQIETSSEEEYDPERPDPIELPSRTGHMGHRMGTTSGSDPEKDKADRRDPELKDKDYGESIRIKQTRKQFEVRMRSMRNATRLECDKHGMVWAKCHMIGFRWVQEDRYKVSQFAHYNCYGVFDGHTGPVCAEKIKRHIFKILKWILQTKTEMSTTVTDEQMAEYIKEMFVRADQWLYGRLHRHDCDDGATVCVIIHDTAQRKVHFGNLGDSRGILIAGNEQIFKTKDHKPDNPDEKERLEKIEGCKVEKHRINGNLSLSRGLGDFSYKARPRRGKNVILRTPTPKEDMISTVADVYSHSLDELKEKYPGLHITAIVATDGVFHGYKRTKNVNREIANGINAILYPDTIDKFLKPEEGTEEEIAKAKKHNADLKDKWERIKHHNVCERETDTKYNEKVLDYQKTSDDKRWPHVREIFGDSDEDKLRECVKYICRRSLQRGSKDNMTCFLVKLV